jgi:acyl-CoA synthetase (AMP-forming)/AMP-acid ligase II
MSGFTASGANAERGALSEPRVRIASMETPLSPLDFARRTRRLHADREAVVDGSLRLTYRQFFDRCDRWSSALQGLGVARGDRVATISPNTHAQLESFYSVPQLGAVLVPINYRLTAEDFVYIVNHSGAACSAWPRSTWRRWTASATGCLG